MDYPQSGKFPELVYSKANYNSYIEISKYGQLEAGNIFILGGWRH